MKSNIFISLILSCFINLVFGINNTRIDSMLLLSSKEKSLSEKAKLLNQIAEEYLETSPDKMLYYANQSLEVALQCKDPKYISL